MSETEKIQLSKVVPVESLRGRSDADAEELFALHGEAADFLKGFRWCGGIEEAFAGIVVPGMVGVFLFRITPAREEVDPWVWVIVGDLPPAYITTEGAPNPACALDAYAGAMASWVRAVREGRSVEGEIPVTAPPTPAYAGLLEARLAFLDQEVLWRYGADLAGRRRGS